MSSEGENTKNLSSEVDDKKTEKDAEVVKKIEPPVNDAEVKPEKENSVSEKVEKPVNDVKDDKEEKVNDVKAEVKVNDKNDKKDKDEKVKEDDKKPEAKSEDDKTENSEEEEEVEKEDEASDKDEEEDDDEEGEEVNNKDKKDKDKKDKDVPLLDQPLEKSGTRDRKRVQRFTEEKKDDKEKEKDKDDKKFEIPEGSGTNLGDIPRIDASISRFKTDDLKLLHKVLFQQASKTTLIKKNIKQFNGYDFKKDSDEYKKKVTAIQKLEVKQMKIVCEMLDLDKKGNKDDLSEKIIEFLMEPKDSGKPVAGGRPRRSAAVKANNRGYSSHDDSYSDEAPRARRNMGKRANLKDETSSESDDDFEPSDNSDEERPSVTKRKRVGRAKKPKADDSEEDEEEGSAGSLSNVSGDSDDEPKNKKKKPVVISKPKGKTPTRGKGRPPANAASPKKKAAPPPRRGGRKKAETSEDDDGVEDEESEKDEEEDGGSSSEDEPLAKKSAKASPEPPTDDDIKTYVKEILEGANLEEITMKTVCKQVYAHYPEFDLTHKKDYIKTTVKSLIST